MTFEQFVEFVSEYAKAENIKVKFERANGRFYARYEDGSAIVGNPMTKEVWGIRFNGTVIRRMEVA